jgi:glutamyl-tRNA synthetase
MSTPRLRFSPSPTGYLHIGSLRTVLFTYFIAKNLEGKLILRIEDTDQKREVAGATEKLIEVLNKFNIDFDEGPHVGGDFGPYIQSQRVDIYRKYSQELLEKGEAYHCFCTPERLEKMRADQQAAKLPPRYDRTCRDLGDEEVKRRIAGGEKFVIRQKMPLLGHVTVHDELRGDIIFQAADLEDQVLIKSNGIPTYQFAVVVDDYLMEITHVTRADEWIPSFPKNILLYQSFGWEPPKFIHYPVILNKTGGKLSKRQGDVAVEDFLDKGYLTEALINFCALLGWHPKTDNEILSREDIIKNFKYADIGISPAIFDSEKLDYFNGYYIRHLQLDKLVEYCLPYLKKDDTSGTEINSLPKTFIKKIIALEQERLKKLSDIAEVTKFFFNLPEYEASLLVWKNMELPSIKKNLENVIEILEKITNESWTNNSIEEALMSYITARELKTGEYLWPMRASLSGQKASPSPFDIAEVLEKKETLKRINIAINKIKF